MRTRQARNFARNFAAELVENAEVHWQKDTGLTEEEMEEAQRELARIAARIEATIRQKPLKTN